MKTILWINDNRSTIGKIRIWTMSKIKFDFIFGRIEWTIQTGSKLKKGLVTGPFPVQITHLEWLTSS